MRRPLTLAFGFACLSPTVSALVVPFQGWVPINGNADHWQDAGGSCLIKEERYGQAFPELTSQQAALAFSNKLRAALGAQKLTDVITQPVQRQNNTWAILASYGYQEGGVTYRITQLYVSNSGLLRTVSGSTAVNNTSSCTADMRAYIRALGY